MKPNKSDLCSELEKMLEPTDYLQPSAWTPANTTAIVDVMAHLRHMRLANLNTFGDFVHIFLVMYTVFPIMQTVLTFCLTHT